MLYIIGLGLNHDGISKFGLEAVSKCKRVYLENYTVDFPYSIGQLQEVLDKKVTPVDREFVEGLEFLDEAQKMDVALLVYGSPLTATTHITILNEAKASGIRYKVIYNASILDAIAETGLQLYKFGKVASLPDWKDKGESDSFMDIVKENQSIKAHSLILVDIGLELQDALEELETAAKSKDVKLGKFAVCSQMGMMKKKIYYGSLEDLKEIKSVSKPYCIIIPSKMHFLEKEILEEFRLE